MTKLASTLQGNAFSVTPGKGDRISLSELTWHNVDKPARHTVLTRGKQGFLHGSSCKGSVA